MSFWRDRTGPQRIIIVILALVAIWWIVWLSFFGLKETARARIANTPIEAGSEQSWEQMQTEMDAKALKLPVGEQLDMMIEARKQRADMSRTAGRSWGNQHDAPLVNYVFRQWSYEKAFGAERWNQLLDKFARDGRPSIAQLATYQKLIGNCKYTYNEQDPQADCRALEEAIACTGHCVSGDASQRGASDDMCLTHGEDLTLVACRK